MSNLPNLGPKSALISRDEHNEDSQSENEILCKIKVDETLSESDIRARWTKVFKILLGEGDGNGQKE